MFPRLVDKIKQILPNSDAFAMTIKEIQGNMTGRAKANIKTALEKAWLAGWKSARNVAGDAVSEFNDELIDKVITWWAVEVADTGGYLWPKEETKTGRWLWSKRPYCYQTLALAEEAISRFNKDRDNDSLMVPRKCVVKQMWL